MARGGPVQAERSVFSGFPEILVRWWTATWVLESLSETPRMSMMNAGQSAEPKLRKFIG
jgi:hypothetical protein